MRVAFIFIIALTINSIGLLSQNPVGIWKTIDDKTGKAKSHVQIYKNGNQYEGKVIKLLEAATTTVCDKCTGSNKGKPLVGMVILKGLEPYKTYWKDGEIFDPASGNSYGCSIWFEGNDTKKLYVRGKHWSGLFRDQVWHKVE